MAVRDKNKEANGTGYKSIVIKFILPMTIQEKKIKKSERDYERLKFPVKIGKKDGNY